MTETKYCCCEEPQLITVEGRENWCNECGLDIPKERVDLLQKPPLPPKSVSKPKPLLPGQVAAQMRQAMKDISTLKMWLRDYNGVKNWNCVGSQKLEHFYNIFGTDQTQWLTKMREQSQTAENYLKQAKKWYDEMVPAGVNLRTLPKKKQRQLGLLPPV